MITEPASLLANATTTTADLAAQRDAWGTSGWTRRRFLGGVGMVGAAALASQLVTSRVALATTPDRATVNTVVVIFLRGAADGLRMLSPHSSDLGLTYVNEVRAKLVPVEPIDLDAGGWALSSCLKPLHDTLWPSGELAFVPAVSAPDISRSHFQAQQFLEKGGANASSTGYLDRALTAMGAGTTFRAVSIGSSSPLSLLGTAEHVGLSSLKDYAFPADKTIKPAVIDAMDQLYRGISGDLARDVPQTIASLSDAALALKASTARSDATYAKDDFASALQDLAAMLRAEIGVQVAAIDVGGWDTHTDEAHDMDGHLKSFGQSLAAFMNDLGVERRKRVTVVVQTEFGRRIAMNASGGSDHGHGSLMMLLGGGLRRSGVFGRWNQLNKDTLDYDGSPSSHNGDVPGLNSPFDVLGEVLTSRLSVGSLSSVFPKHEYAPIGFSA